MSSDEFLALFGGRTQDQPPDPMRPAEGPGRGSAARRNLTRRFYRDVSLLVTDHGLALQLDGKTARTPARRPVVIQNATIATALMHEWHSQADAIDPAQMPLVRLMNAALDGVADQADAVRSEIKAYAASDLICYRADTPQELVLAQSAAWDALLAWADTALQAPLLTASGVIHVEQPLSSRTGLEKAVDAMVDPAALAALSSATTISGSLVIALALAKGHVSADAAWHAAHVDEHYQARVWGQDDEAVARLVNRRRDFDAAALVLASLRPTGE